MNANVSCSAKVAFITGGSRGIGFETARQLGKLGMRVVLCSRGERGESAAQLLRSEGLDACALRCDVTNARDRQAAFDYLDTRFGKLDVLINNAGIWVETKNSSEKGPNQTSALPIALLRETFESNFFAPIQLTQLLLPLLRKAPAARIVNLSSMLASLQLHSDPQSSIFEIKTLAYNASKTALNAFTVHLAHELHDTPIKVNSVDPGWVRTDMGGDKAILDVVQGSRTSVAFATLPDDGPTGGFIHLGQRLPW